MKKVWTVLAENSVQGAISGKHHVNNLPEPGTNLLVNASSVRCTTQSQFRHLFFDHRLVTSLSDLLSHSNQITSGGRAQNELIKIAVLRRADDERQSHWSADADEADEYQC